MARKKKKEKQGDSVPPPVDVDAVISEIEAPPNEAPIPDVPDEKRGRGALSCGKGAIRNQRSGCMLLNGTSILWMALVVVATIVIALFLGEGLRLNVLQLITGFSGATCVFLAVRWRRHCPGLWNWVFVLLIGVPLGLCVSPILRDAFGIGRPFYTGVELWMLRTLMFGVFAFAVFVVVKPRYQLSDEQAFSSWSIVCSLTLFCFLALLGTLIGYWSSTADLSQWLNVKFQSYYSSRDSGLLPFSDNRGWYVGSRLVEEGVPVTWTARRPVHTLIRAGELWLTGSGYRLSLIIQAFVCACGISAFSIGIWRVLSPMAGLLAAVGTVSLMQPFVGLYLSGCVGFTMASAAVGFLLLGCQAGSYRWRLLGSIALGLAWLTRPGPLGVLAVPIVFEWVLKGKHRFLRGMLAGALLVGTLLVGRGAFALIAAPGAAQNANAAITIYGIAFGTGWSEGTDQFLAEDPSRESLSASEAASLQYELAWKQFQEHPGITVSVLFENLYDAIKGIFVLPSTMWFLPLAKFFSALTFIVVSVVSILAIPKALKNRKGFGWLLVGGWIAFAVSTPVIWGDGQMRGALILLPFIIPFFLLFFAASRPAEGRIGEEPDRSDLIPGICSVVSVVALALLGGLVFQARKGEQPTALDQIRVELDPAIFVVAEPAYTPVLGAAHMTKEELVRVLEETWGLDDFIATIEPPALLVQTAESESYPWTIVRGAKPRSGTIIIEKSRALDHFEIREAVNWHWLDD
jgi:hypothetical protein